MTQWGLPATSVFLHFSLFINGNPATHPISHLGAEACCYLFLTFKKKLFYGFISYYQLIQYHFKIAFRLSSSRCLSACS